MGSGINCYEYEKRGKFKDYDMKADAELGTFKIRRYHLDEEASIHPLHSVRIDLECSYKIRFEVSRVPKSWDSFRQIKGIGGMEASIEKKDASEEDFEEEVLASFSLFMDIDTGEDYLRFINELERPPEYSSLRSSQPSAPDVSAEASVRQSGSYNDSSYDLSGVWQSQLSGPSS
ncbi:hypothetical protein PIB30_037273 [Stylosanthes scabra]|uniref:Uncharacterized protein n=1 Tax=Stylosanthes scabra TaxID=79078 RepID=A0ABU6VDN9_9FABA|nr:hypothetical protein [Stylosanthes scabra]